jgi:hypothetical protein
MTIDFFRASCFITKYGHAAHIEFFTVTDKAALRNFAMIQYLDKNLTEKIAPGQEKFIRWSKIRRKWKADTTE